MVSVLIDVMHWYYLIYHDWAHYGSFETANASQNLTNLTKIINMFSSKKSSRNLYKSRQSTRSNKKNV